MALSEFQASRHAGDGPPRVGARGPGPLPVPLQAVRDAARACYRRPSIVTALMILAISVPYRADDVTASGHVTVADLGAVALTLVTGLRILGGDRPVRLRGVLPFVGVLVALAVATITAQDTGVALLGFLRYVELFVLVPVAVAVSVRDRRDLLLVAGALVAVSAFEGALGVWQFLTRTGASYGGEFIRAVGTFGALQVLAMGALVGYGIIVTLGLGLALQGRRGAALVVLAVALLVPLALSLSRGSWIATAGSVLVMLVIYDWRKAVATAVLATALGVVAMGGLGIGTSSEETFGQRVSSIVSSTSEPDRSVQDRYALWQTAGKIWATHPATGVGLKNFPEFRDSYAPMSLSSGSDVASPTLSYRREPLLSAHNMYLLVLSEQGLIGIVAFLVLLGTLAIGSVRGPRTGDPPDDPTTARFLRLVAPAVMAWTLLDFMYGDIGAGPTGILLATVLGLATRRCLRLSSPALAARPGPQPGRG